ncbi:MAG: HAD-IA family hydrolase [FCB group bacterium]|nr:HAD-IA family hydrolase [FCB group bacterium]
MTISIQNIVFDLGNIIVDVNYRHFTDAMGWKQEDYVRLFETPFFRAFETGKQDEDAFFRQIGDYLPFGPEDERRFRDNIHLAFPLRPRIWDIVKRIRERYRIFLFSNTNSLDFNSILKKIDLREPFEAVYASHEQGYVKPDEKAYEKAQRLFNIDPSETIFFDDRQENVAGAQAAGWQAVRSDSEEHLLQTLLDYKFITPEEII